MYCVKIYMYCVANNQLLKNSIWPTCPRETKILAKMSMPPHHTSTSPTLHLTGNRNPMLPPQLQVYTGRPTGTHSNNAVTV